MFLCSKIFHSQQYLQDVILLFHRVPLPLPSILPQRQADAGWEPLHDDRYRQVGQSTAGGLFNLSNFSCPALKEKMSCSLNDLWKPCGRLWWVILLFGSEDGNGHINDPQDIFFMSGCQPLFVRNKIVEMWSSSVTNRTDLGSAYDMAVSRGGHSLAQTGIDHFQ